MDFQLTEQEKALRDLARDFAERHVRPGLLEREWEPDTAKRMPWDIVDAGSEAGLRTLTVPAEYGGPDPTPSLLALALVVEELAAVDPGIANTFNHALKDPTQVAALGTQEQKDWFFPEYLKDPRYLTATAGSEPNHGSDWQLPYEDFHFDTTAVLDGDEWVINGEKTCISHGMFARLMLVYACTDPTKPFSQGTTCFLVPRGPGVLVGSHQPKLGFRLLNNCGIVFDNCRIPKSFVLGEVNGGKGAREAILGHDCPYTVAVRLGTSRSAYEEAVEYAKLRIQGGKPIIEHQAVALKLGEMYSLVEAMRAFMHTLAWMGQYPEHADQKYKHMASWFCAESTVRIATLAMQVTGCGGTWLSLYGQKHMRDAVMSYGGDGTHTVQLLRAVRALAAEPSKVHSSRIASMRKP